MIVYKRKRQRRRRRYGTGLVNSIINTLPVELHVPGYQYCGPGTKLAKRLARGDLGINPLDAACKQHDIAYSENRDNLTARHETDKGLAEKAWHRVLAKDASIGEKAVAYGLANTMDIKRKLGMGLKKMKAKRKIRTGSKQIVKMAKESMRPGTDALKSSLKGAREATRKAGGKKKVRLPRILPLPTKVGGFLPFFIPLFAGLNATGALPGGAAGIAKAVNDANAAKRQLEESKRHNGATEAIALGKGL